MPLSQEQFKKAREAGFSTEQIIEFEKKRKSMAMSGGGQPAKFESIPEKNKRIGGEQFSKIKAGAKSTIDLVATPLTQRISGKTLTQRSQESPIAKQLPRDIPEAMGQFNAGLARDVGAYTLDTLSSPLTWIAGGGVKPIQKLAGNLTKKGINSTKETVNKIVSPLRDYAGNKVTATRAGMKEYYKKEIAEYGKMLDSLGDVKGEIKAEPLMENFTQSMVNRRLYDPLSEKWVKPLNKVDSQLLKSYTSIGRKWQNGNVKIKDIIEEYKNIRDSAPIDSSLGRQARNLANDLLNSIKDQIDIPAFKSGQARYANFKEIFDSIDDKIDVFGNSIKTGKGERFLTNYLTSTKENRLVGQNITKVTGQTLKGARIINAVRNLPAMKLLFR